MAGNQTSANLTVWKNAPKERTAAYFQAYSSVSRAIQQALRTWTREWFYVNPQLLPRYSAAYQILVYFCTHPFRGKPANLFTYDVQRTELIERAFVSAAANMERALKHINTAGLAWKIRERYFSYRYKEVVRYVTRNHSILYQMLNADTMLMNAVLRFALVDIPKLGLEGAAAGVRTAFTLQLRRLSDEFDLSWRSDELLQIATDTIANDCSSSKSCDS